MLLCLSHFRRWPSFYTFERAGLFEILSEEEEEDTVRDYLRTVYQDGVNSLCREAVEIRADVNFINLLHRLTDGCLRDGPAQKTLIGIRRMENLPFYPRKGRVNFFVTASHCRSPSQKPAARPFGRHRTTI